MNKLRNWTIVIAIAAFVAGAVALEAQPTGWLSLLIQESSGAVQSRGLGVYGAPVLVGRGTAVPTGANSGAPPQDGEIFIVTAASTAPDVQIYDANSATWLTIANVDAAQAFNGTVTLGSNDVDDITINGPVTYNVAREDFTTQGFYVLEEDGTAIAVTDTAENHFHVIGSPLDPFWFSFEQAFGGTFTPFAVSGELDTSGMVDVADTDGLDFTFGAADPLAGGNSFDEDTSNSTYCEIGVTIGTIANIDTLYFGWHLIEARTAFDANAHNGLNTYAVFTVQDNAGDLDIETELNGGGTLLDEITGNVWADAEQNILRVTLLADSVTFTLDGTAVTQTNAILNLDATDQMVCFFGYQQSAAAADANITLQYVEIGRSQ